MFKRDLFFVRVERTYFTRRAKLGVRLYDDRELLPHGPNAPADGKLRMLASGYWSKPGQD